MRIAWFRHSEIDTTDLLDATASLIDQLRSTHTIDVIVEAKAHDFVWQDIQQPWELCVFELDNTAAHQFIWGYLTNYPGVVLFHTIDVAGLRVAILASRAIVVSDSGLAERLRVRFPGANVRYVAPSGAATGFATRDAAGGADLTLPRRNREAAEATRPRLVKFAVFDDRPLVGRAFERARNAGATFDVLDFDTPGSVLERCDVVIAPAWPPFHSSPSALLAAMGAGKALVTTETEARATWPAIDPQTWRPRGLAVEQAPVAVTVDPRDEEHSLMLAIRRLSADAELRDQLGRAARAWWETNARPAHAAAAWMNILGEAPALSPPPRSQDWPKKFVTDGTELARDILSEFGVITSHP